MRKYILLWLFVFKGAEMMEERWLSMKEISEYLGVTRETIYKWIENREMPGHRMGKFWKFKRDEVDVWVKSGKAADRDRSCWK